MLVSDIRMPRFTASGSRTSISSNCSGVRAMACSMMYPNSRHQIAIEVDVVVSASVPAELRGHSPLLHPPPSLGIPVDADGAVDRGGNPRRGEIHEGKPIFKIVHG